jgi:hypothetical protein
MKNHYQTLGIKRNAETKGYNKKSSEVCGVSVLGIIICLFVAVILTIGNK